MSDLYAGVSCKPDTRRPGGKIVLFIGMFGGIFVGMFVVMFVGIFGGMFGGILVVMFVGIFVEKFVK